MKYFISLLFLFSAGYSSAEEVTLTCKDEKKRKHYVYTYSSNHAYADERRITNKKNGESKKEVVRFY